MFFIKSKGKYYQFSDDSKILVKSNLDQKFSEDQLALNKLQNFGEEKKKSKNIEKGIATAGGATLGAGTGYLSTLAGLGVIDKAASDSLTANNLLINEYKWLDYTQPGISGTKRVSPKFGKEIYNKLSKNKLVKIYNYTKPAANTLLTHSNKLVAAGAVAGGIAGGVIAKKAVSDKKK